MGFQLSHRTNYWGAHIDATDNDDEVDFAAVWVQALEDNRSCCPGFGRRRVRVENQDLSEHAEWWWLFRVSARYGRSDGHYFMKFVLIPQGEPGYGKRGCAQRGWSLDGEVSSDNALAGLQQLVEHYFDDDEGDFIHVHIGIKMDGVYAGQGNS